MQTFVLNKFGNIAYRLYIHEISQDHIFGQNWHINLSEIIRQYWSNRRQNTIGVKTRSLVEGSNKKPWRQKGTGRARHGTKKSPIWVSGGVSHGPSTNRLFKKKINKKAKVKFLVGLVDKFIRQKKLYLIVQNCKCPVLSSKYFVHWLQKFKFKHSAKMAFFDFKYSTKLKLICRNLPLFTLNNNSQFNVISLFKYDQVFMSIEFFNYFFSKINYEK